MVRVPIFAVVRIRCPVCESVLVMGEMREGGHDLLTKTCPTCHATIVYRKDPATGKMVAEEVRPS